MTDIKLADLDAGNRQVVAKAVHKELSPYIKSLARKHAKQLGCEPGDIEGDAAVLILERIDTAIERANTSVVAYLRTAVANSINSRLIRPSKSPLAPSNTVDYDRALHAFDAQNSYTIERRAEIGEVLTNELTDLEYRVCMSRIAGESWRVFVAANPDITRQRYFDTVQSVRGKLASKE